MKPTQKLHEAGQSLWLDNITRELLTSGTLASYIDELSITGLTSNPTIFDHAIEDTDAYDEPISLAAPFTVNTMPEKTLHAFADHGQLEDSLPADGGDANEVLSAFAAAGVDDDELAAKLQPAGADSFNASWDRLLACISARTDALATTG